MEARVARFRSLRPDRRLRRFGDPRLRTPHLPRARRAPDAPLAAEDFHLSFVRCEAGKAAPLHNHLTQEVFIALTGRWEVFWGPDGERRIVLEPWDTISIPPGVSRGFRNIATEASYLIGMASGHDPGNINWPAPVRAAALAVGVTLP